MHPGTRSAAGRRKRARSGGLLWWALALRACLGGNGTLIGASANVVAVGLADQAGHKTTILPYLKICFPPMLIAIAISMVRQLSVAAR